MARQAKPANEDNRSRPERKALRGANYLHSKTIGTSVSYPLQILNVSDNGMKLRWDSSQKLPFLENTLIEISLPIKLGKDLPEQVIKYLAKVVRLEGLEGGEVEGQEFGIKMIFLEPKNHQMWKEAVSYLH